MTFLLGALPVLADEIPPHPTPPYNIAQATPSDDTSAATPTTPQSTPGSTTVVVPAPAPTTVVVPAPPPPAAASERPVVVDQRPVNVTVIQSRPEIGMAVSLGGGVGQFTDSAIRDRTSPNGEYEARILFGTHSILAAEAAYVGTAGSISALGLSDNAVLISNGVEGLARLNLNIPGSQFQPFVVGGASWVRYNVVNSQMNVSDVRSQDDVLVVPVGAGMASYIGDTGFMADVRFMYHFTFDDELLRPTVANSTGASLSNWNVSLRLGYAF